MRACVSRALDGSINFITKEMILYGSVTGCIATTKFQTLESCVHFVLSSGPPCQAFYGPLLTATTTSPMRTWFQPLHLIQHGATAKVISLKDINTSATRGLCIPYLRCLLTVNRILHTHQLLWNLYSHRYSIKNITYATLIQVWQLRNFSAWTTLLYN